MPRSRFILPSVTNRAVDTMLAAALRTGLERLKMLGRKTQAGGRSSPWRRDPTDFVGVEVECVVSGIETEYQPPYWRGQPYQGLAMRHRSKESFVAFAQGFPEQYTLTKAALTDRSPEAAGTR